VSYPQTLEADGYKQELRASSELTGQELAKS
jgi:hypothetical protein